MADHLRCRRRTEDSFLTARCGFAVLHPLEGVIGRPAIIEHVDGAREQAVFPDLIAPSQPFKEIRAIEHPVAPGVAACCRMTGDIFEMEDQRNWSDASYKTYVRPLTLPWPYVMESGVRNRQSVELQITDSNPARMQQPMKMQSRMRPLQVEIGGRTAPFRNRSRHPSQPDRDHAGSSRRARKAAAATALFHFDPTAGHGRERTGRLSRIAQIAAASQMCA